jgi:hypothetical protein
LVTKSILHKTFLNVKGFVNLFYLSMQNRKISCYNCPKGIGKCTTTLKGY